MTTQWLQWRRVAIRRLLQLDQQAPARSQAELVAEAQQNYRWNFTFGLLDGAFFWFGSSFVSAATILPLFVSKLTDNPLIIALLPILGQATWYLPQLFTAGLTERLARKKPVVINLGFFVERMPTWFMPLAALMSLAAPRLALVMFLVAYGLHGLGAGAIAPAWSDLIARCFPVERRGWFFGFTAFVGAGLGALGALFSGWLLEQYAFPTNFVYAFLLAALMILLSWVFLAQMRETVEPTPPRPQGRRANRAKIGRILRGDQNFRHFLQARLLGNLSSMGVGFITVVALHRWQVSDGMVGLFTIALLSGQTLGTLVAGVVADRFGNKQTLMGSFSANTAAFLLAWQAPTSVWYFPVFLLVGFGLGMHMVAGVLIALEFSVPAHRPTYVGIANTANGIGIAIAPLVGGLLATLSYEWLFLASATAGIGAVLLFHTCVHDPRFQREFLRLE
ncbi:MAG: MFS transporter [Caldilineaceae bacterium]